MELEAPLWEEPLPLLGTKRPSEVNDGDSLQRYKRLCVGSTGFELGDGFAGGSIVSPSLSSGQYGNGFGLHNAMDPLLSIFNAGNGRFLSQGYDPSLLDPNQQYPAGNESSLSSLEADESPMGTMSVNNHRDVWEQSEDWCAKQPEQDLEPVLSSMDSSYDSLGGSGDSLETSMITDLAGDPTITETTAKTEVAEINRKSASPSTDSMSIDCEEAENDVPTRLSDIKQTAVEAPPDSCYGVVLANATSSFRGGSSGSIAPVNLKPCGDSFMLTFQDSGKHAGILSESSLCRLLEEFHVQLSATLIAETTKPSSESQTNKVATMSSRICQLRIVVCGQKDNRHAVGNLLSEAKLYLQHPSSSECDNDLEYCNPHYLVPPGNQLPLLEEIQLSPNTSETAATKPLGEVERGQLIRLFDQESYIDLSPNVSTSPRLNSTLYRHQLIALFMMLHRESSLIEGSPFPSIWQLNGLSKSTERFCHIVTGERRSVPKAVRGGILADEMGLGKSLSILALVCSSLDAVEVNKPSKSRKKCSTATLIVTPKSTIPSWCQQIEKHIRPNQIEVSVYHGSDRHQRSADLETSSIILTTYETLKSDWLSRGALYSINWFRVVLDEAHNIRNRSSQAFKAASAIQAQRRWCVTGTPIQNCLDDFGALLSFLDISPFKDKRAFDYWVARPVKAQAPNSLPRLQNLIRATSLRRTKRTLGDMCRLVKRSEKVEMLEFSEADLMVYKFFETKCSDLAQSKAFRKAETSGKSQQQGSLLTAINTLRAICDGGEQLLSDAASTAWKGRHLESADLDAHWMQELTCVICKTDIETTVHACDDFTSSPIGSTCAAEIDLTHSESDYPRDSNSAASSSAPITMNASMSRHASSAKIDALLNNLHTEQRDRINKNTTDPPIKSCWTKMLDLIQVYIQAQGLNFCRIDGATTLHNRQDALHQFDTDQNCTVMLASIGSAGEGIDLTAANHVHLVEPHWNPMVEAQAVDRIHRIGQVRDVVVTRYIMVGSIETYIQEVQKDKLRMINQSIDADQVSLDGIEKNHWEKLRIFLNDQNRSRN